MRQSPRTLTVPLRAIVAASLTLGLVLALAAPAAAAPSLTIDPSPAATNVTTPLFTFTTDADTVECAIDPAGTAIPTYGPCSGGASHSHAPAAPLGEGDWVLHVRATTGLEQTEDSRAFTIDLTPPSLSIDPPEDPTNDDTPSFAFTTDAASVACSVDQGTPAYGACTSGATHHAGTPLPDGTNVFRVLATDAAGNQAEASRTFVVDTIPPTVSVTSGPEGPTNVATPTFGFSAVPDAVRVECSLEHGGPDWGPCSGVATHTPPAPLPDDSYTFRVRAWDAAGNVGSDSQDFSVDHEAPSLSIDSGPAGPTNDTTPAFGFTAQAGASVECTLDQGTTITPCASPFVIPGPLAEGRHMFRVRATRFGNEAIVSRTFTVDTTPPSLAIVFGPSGATNDSTPLFGFAAETGAAVACSIDQGTPAYGACASPTTHAAAAPLADGAYVFRVLATDGAGNQTVLTRAFVVSQSPAGGTPRPTPTTPTPRTTPPRAVLRLLSPFPLVRISGTLTRAGVRVRLLAVRGPHGALVRVTVSPPCSAKRPSARRCRARQAAGTVGRGGLVEFRRLARSYRSGTVIVVRVWAPGRIGKYTRFTIVRDKAPRRVDQCLVPAATHGSRCPSA